MNRVVIKRDGLEKNFDIACIEDAIKKAAIAADKEINDFDDIISKITNKLNKEKVTVEEIQDVIEHTLMVSKYKDVAKKFIEYRHERDLARQSKSKIIRDVEGFLSQSSDEFVKENANIKDGYWQYLTDTYLLNEDYVFRQVPKEERVKVFLFNRNDDDIKFINSQLQKDANHLKS